MGSMIPPRMRDGVLERDGGRCVIAGPFCTVVATVADHRANRGHGGSKVLNDPRCLVAACELCNGWKEDAHGEDRERLIYRGIRVEKDSTNAKTVSRCANKTVLYPDGRWFFLLADGTREEVTEPPF